MVGAAPRPPGVRQLAQGLAERGIVSNLFATLRDVVVILSGIAAGVWAIYRYKKQREAHKGRYVAAIRLSGSMVKTRQKKGRTMHVPWLQRYHPRLRSTSEVVPQAAADFHKGARCAPCNKSASEDNE
jgi:hypothetical protein